MDPAPESLEREYRGSGKLAGKAALITGGDSGIGRAVALCFAKEGAEVMFVYLDEHDDARTTLEHIEQTGARGWSLAGDLGDERFIHEVVETARQQFGTLDILVNNAAEQHPCDHIAEISPAQLEKTFRTNFFSLFNLTREILPSMHKGSCIINTTSVTAYRGSPHLLDYSATKGAIVSFTRSLALQLVPRGIRVNAVAPGPVWTPLIPSTFSGDEVEHFGARVPMQRPGQPDEIAPAYVYLASSDSSFVTGQVLHPNGGEIING